MMIFVAFIAVLILCIVFLGWETPRERQRRESREYVEQSRAMAKGKMKNNEVLLSVADFIASYLKQATENAKSRTLEADEREFFVVLLKKDNISYYFGKTKKKDPYVGDDWAYDVMLDYFIYGTDIHLIKSLDFKELGYAPLTDTALGGFFAALTEALETKGTDKSYFRWHSDCGSYTGNKLFYWELTNYHPCNELKKFM